MIHAAGIWLAKPWRDRGNRSPVVSKQATKKTAGKPVDRKEKIDGVSTSSDRTPCYGHASSLVKEQKKISCIDSRLAVIRKRTENIAWKLRTNTDRVDLVHEEQNR
jgi:hypothetical protein